MEAFEDRLYLRPVFAAVLREESPAQGGRNVIIEAIEAVKLAALRAPAKFVQEFLEPEWLAGAEEGEQRPLVLCQTAKKRTDHQGYGGVEGHARFDQLSEFLFLKRADATAEC